MDEEMISLKQVALEVLGYGVLFANHCSDS